MKIRSLYMAGAMGCYKDEPEKMNGWRLDSITLLNSKANFKGVKLEIVNPVDYFNFEEPRKYKTQEEIMDFDLWQVVHSDLILVNLDRINDSAGTIIELYQAKLLNIPVVAFGDDSNLHPWIRECTNRIEDDLVGAVGYINEFYL